MTIHNNTSAHAGFENAEYIALNWLRDSNVRNSAQTSRRALFVSAAVRVLEKGESEDKKPSRRTD